MTVSSKSERARGWSVELGGKVASRALSSDAWATSRRCKHSGEQFHPNVDLPPVSSHPISISQLAHRSEAACEICAMFKVMCGAEGRNGAR